MAFSRRKPQANQPSVTRTCCRYDMIDLRLLRLTGACDSGPLPLLRAKPSRSHGPSSCKNCQIVVLLHSQKSDFSPDRRRYSAGTGHASQRHVAICDHARITQCHQYPLTSHRSHTSVGSYKMRGEFPHSSPAVSVLYTQRKLTFVPDAQTSFRGLLQNHDVREGESWRWLAQCGDNIGTHQTTPR